MRSECEYLTTDLFAGIPDLRPTQELMAEGAVLLHGFAKPGEADLLADLRDIVEQARFRHMITPGGHQMSVAMTNCGGLGWVTDRTGYRYDANDPETGRPWPAMPLSFRELAEQAAEHAGFSGFSPDACLINRYQPGARMSLHQDKDELISARRSSRCRWACPRPSCSADCSAAIGRAGFDWSTATSPCGADRCGWRF